VGRPRRTFEKKERKRNGHDDSEVGLTLLVYTAQIGVLTHDRDSRLKVTQDHWQRPRTQKMSNTIALYVLFLSWFIPHHSDGRNRYPLSNFTFRLAIRSGHLLVLFVFDFFFFSASLFCFFFGYPICSTKEAQPEEDPSVSARLQRLQNNYEDFGMRRTVEGILVVHDHGHPHILMLQIANAFFKLYVSHNHPTRGSQHCFSHRQFPFSPGDYLKPGEDEIDGLKRRLDDRLAPPTESRQFNASHGVDNEWEIGDCLAQWWRPNFETFMVPRPQPLPRSLCSPPVTAVPFHPGTHHQTKRMQKTLPCPDARTKCDSLSSPPLAVQPIFSAEVLAVPKNMKLLAIPLFELYDNAARYVFFHVLRRLKRTLNSQFIRQLRSPTFSNSTSSLSVSITPYSNP